MDQNFETRVKVNTSLLPAHVLLPLFDALVNALHAIEDRGTSDGRIRIEIQRDVGDQVLSGQEESRSVTGFTITDNGIGFDDTNFRSFETTDSPHKLRRGGRGVGRLLWLKAFERVSVDSTFQSTDGHLMRRTFRFSLPDGVSDVRLADAAPGTPVGSRVALEGAFEQYRRRCPKHVSTLAERIIEHSLLLLMQARCPAITLSDPNGSGESISLNDRVREIANEHPAQEITVKGHPLTVRHVRQRTKHGSHRIHYFANDREVLNEPVDLPDLRDNALLDDRGAFWQTTCVQGRVLDESLKADRTAFGLPETALSPDELGIADIRRGVNEEVKGHLSPLIEPLREKRAQAIRALVHDHYPAGRVLLEHYPERVMALPPMKPAQLLTELAKLRSEVGTELQGELKKALDAKPNQTVRERTRHLVRQISAMAKDDLAEYVLRRHVVIDVFDKLLESQPSSEEGDGATRELEEQIHSLVFPLRTTSDDVLDLEDANLWLIDERLAFHLYLASDISFDKITAGAIDSGERPDILAIWNNPASMSDFPTGVQKSVTIIEFKRPMRREYGERDDPFAQVTRYIQRLRDGRGITVKGRPIEVSHGTHFFAYIIADVTPSLSGACTRADFQPLPGEGFFKIHTQLNAYIELLPFSRLVEDAKRRHRAFFEALKLPDLLSTVVKQRWEQSLG